MRDGMTRIDTFLNELEAEIALGRLESLGVTAVLEKDNCGGLRPHLDLQRGVRLLVLNTDLEKARGILDETNSIDATAAWSCPNCAENIESGFDTCWQCGHKIS